MNLIDYEWRLREVMATRGLFSTTKLIPLLNERGVYLSSSQVYRLAAEKPERLNLKVLVALMDALGCTADDLVIKVEAGTATVEATGTDGVDAVDALTALKRNGFRPPRANISPSTTEH